MPSLASLDVSTAEAHGPLPPLADELDALEEPEADDDDPAALLLPPLLALLLLLLLLQAAPSRIRLTASAVPPTSFLRFNTMLCPLWLYETGLVEPRDPPRGPRYSITRIDAAISSTRRSPPTGCSFGPSRP